MVFAGFVSGGRFTGTVQQGALSGTFRARRGEDRGVVAAGFYGRQAVVDDPYGQERFVDVDSGAVNALYPSGERFVIGSGFATRAPDPRLRAARRAGRERASGRCGFGAATRFSPER